MDNTIISAPSYQTRENIQAHTDIVQLGSMVIVVSSDKSTSDKANDIRTYTPPNFNLSTG